eukprot:Skav202222  [mRNA]  locus=scaffold2694:32189:41526:+ [translate_table: standard]
MSGCPVPPAELRKLGGKLAELADWIESSVVSSAGSSSRVSSDPRPLGVSGYPKGSPLDRARAALGPPETPFPGTLDLTREQNWRLVVAEEPARWPCDLRTAEEGPPVDLPPAIAELASFVSWDRAEGLESLSDAFQVGFWARINCRTHTYYRGPRVLSEPAFQFIVLRAPGVGKAVRLRRFLCWCVHFCSSFVGTMLTLADLKPVSSGEHTLLVFSVPEEFSYIETELDCYAVPILKRAGGFLLALPVEVLKDRVIRDGMTAGDDVLFGPSSTFKVELIEEAEDGTLQSAGTEVEVMVIDVKADILDFMREYQPQAEMKSEWVFIRLKKTVPAKSAGPAATKKAAAPKRVNTAALASQLADLASQVQFLMSCQREVTVPHGAPTAKGAAGPPMAAGSKLPAVSDGLSQATVPAVVKKAASLIGPPPKIKPAARARSSHEAVMEDEPVDPQGVFNLPEETGIAKALSQQSTAITALVAHLTSQGSDAISDLMPHVPSMSSTKGVQKRERMQQDLASGSSLYHQQLLQQVHRRLHPAFPTPSSEVELKQVSLLEYLERNGGFKHNREMGLIAWTLGYALDCATQEDWRKSREVMSLLFAAMEQSMVDRGDWSLAFLLTLLEEPPPQVFQDRSQLMLANARPFSPVVPPQWTAVCLAYLKDLEVLSTKKTETSKKANPKSEPAGLSSSKRRRINFRRAMHVIVMALNFWWSGSSFIPLELLRRVPSTCQRALLLRLVNLVLADGPGETFQVLASGRRFPVLIARLGELSACATRLGASAGPYERTYPGHEVPLDNSVLPELEPYRSLNADRLRVVGSGHWDATEFLPPELCMAYRFPDSLLLDRVPRSDEFPMKLDPQEEVLKLARVWDARGVLHLHTVDIQEHRRHELVRVFNCFKDLECDRQIGDRRGRNSVEAKVRGPSVELPAATALLDLYLNPLVDRWEICVTDRRDFYHQFASSPNRTRSNTVGPRVPLSLLRDTKAFEALSMASKVRGSSRYVHGDRLGSHDRCFGSCLHDTCMVAFSSIFQGDHAGVEIATAAHEGLLQSRGLLDHSTRVLNSRPFEGQGLAQGLVIDDYFAVGVVPASSACPGRAMKCLAEAKGAYKDHDILGSDAKDLLGPSEGKVIGAYLDSSEKVRSRGLALLGAPRQKRYGLSWLTLQTCQLRFTTDALHLCILGGWTSLLLFRRPFMSLLSLSFSLVDSLNYCPSTPKLVRFRRDVANELVMLSVLAPLCVADLGAPFWDRIFATDASLQKGAIVSSPVSVKLSEVVWRSCRSKGGYSKLLSPVQSTLSRCLDFEEFEPVDFNAVSSVDRPLAYRFDFVEVFAGAASVTKEMAALGYSTCVPIELSVDAELDVTKVHVLEWLAHLIQNRFIKAFMVEPPCTSFSVMRRPPLRSVDFPFGFDPSGLQVSLGNCLAHRSLFLLYLGLIFGVAGMLENPWSSKIKYLPAWKLLRSKEAFVWLRVDSCAYGSIHLKAFGILGVWISKRWLSGRCDRSHAHVQVQGAYTKKSASYTPLLARAFAKTLAFAISRFSMLDSSVDLPRVQGLESLLINDLSISLPWEVDAVWDFGRSYHINVLELSVVLRLVSRLARQRVYGRVVVLVDSNVVRCAASKGRSSARSLMKVLRRISALCVVCGLYLVFGFVPTRLNPSDDPTRSVPLRVPGESFDLDSWDSSSIYKLANFSRCRRWASNWLRLTLRLLGPCALDFADRSLFRIPRFPAGLVHHSSLDFSGLDFDSTLGFPGEGPSSPVGLWFGMAPRLVVLCFTLCHGVVFPRNAGDLSRQTMRSNRPPLQDGRPVLEVTQNLRRGHLDTFSRWLISKGLHLDEILEDSAHRVDQINNLLVRFGKALYAAGRPYNHYAETINAVSAYKPALRRQLQESWNLAFSWIRDEPSVHHIAMPWQILLAAISVCISWGWLEIAGMFALTWGALLRVGEFLNAVRADLLLPSDTAYTNQFALLSLKEPKTRFTAARHQSAKLDIPDLLQVTEWAFAKLQPHQKPWPMSGQTLRLRFRQVMDELGITSTVTLNGKSLDLGSLRPGGATWVLQQTEDGDFCRRRGRWLNQRVMEVYVQEVASFQFLSVLPALTRDKVFTLALTFPQMMGFARKMLHAEIPLHAWWTLWARFMVVWRATPASRDIDQPASGLCHRLPSHTGRCHLHGLDDDDGDANAGLALEGTPFEFDRLHHLVLHCARGDKRSIVPAED